MKIGSVPESEDSVLQSVLMSGLERTQPFNLCQPSCLKFQVPDMPTRSISEPSRTSSPCRRIAEVVHRSLKRALKDQCAGRYAEDVRLRRLDRASARQLMRLQIECQGRIRMPVGIAATHVGGNVYDIECSVQEGPSRQFSYSLPGASGVALLQAPCLGRKLGTFLLGELERRLGRQILRRKNE